MEERKFLEAFKAVGRTKVILAGITDDSFILFPALTLVKLGCSVQVVADAGGSPSFLSDDVAMRCMQKAGATVTYTDKTIAELAGV